MKSLLKYCWKKTCFITLTIAMSAGTGRAAEPDAAEPYLILHIVNTAQVPDKVIEKAKEHTRRILDQARIQVAWQDDDAPSAETIGGGTGLRISIHLIAEPAVKRLGPFPDAATGFARRAARRAWAFADRARTQAAIFRAFKQIDEPAAEGLILGHIFAHEIGHIMLPHDDHSRSGIMSAQLGPKSLETAMRGVLFFSSSEAGLMREALRSQASLIQP